MIKSRRYLKKQIIKYNKPDNKADFNLLTRTIREEIKQNKNESWQKFSQKFLKNPTSSKPFWAKINKLRSDKVKSGSIPSFFEKGQVYKNDEEKANLFTTHLVKTFRESENDKFDKT
jgi:hypothetical protein